MRTPLINKPNFRPQYDDLWHEGEKYTLDPDNVRILCLLCHMAYDQGTREQFEKRAKGFQS